MAANMGGFSSHGIHGTNDTLGPLGSPNLRPLPVASTIRTGLPLGCRSCFALHRARAALIPTFAEPQRGTHAKCGKMCLLMGPHIT